MSVQSQKTEFPVSKSMVLKPVFELAFFQIFGSERCQLLLAAIQSSVKNTGCARLALQSLANSQKPVSQKKQVAHVCKD